VTLKQAKALREGELVAAVLEDPHGGESHWSSEYHRWIYQPVRAGQVLMFQRLIPKVRIVRNGPWDDAHDQMLLCRTPSSERAWLNIGNAKKKIKEHRRGGET
jgi:hypothetical protein